MARSTMAEQRESPEQDPEGSRHRWPDARPRPGVDDEEPTEVSDSYVARRVAEHRAATMEAARQLADQEEEGGMAAGRRPLGWERLLGLAGAALLPLVISLGTRRFPAPPPPIQAPTPASAASASAPARPRVGGPRTGDRASEGRR